MKGLTEGRIVHYVLQDGEHRPAIVVRVWRVQDYENGEIIGLPHSPENGCCQLQVFTDSDGKLNDSLPPIMWATSVIYSEKPEPHTWHWIESA